MSELEHKAREVVRFFSLPTHHGDLYRALDHERAHLATRWPQLYKALWELEQAVQGEAGTFPRGRFHPDPIHPDPNHPTRLIKAPPAVRLDRPEET